MLAGIVEGCSSRYDRQMGMVAGTSAESKKTAGKCNITHRFDGPASPKNFPFPRLLRLRRIFTETKLFIGRVRFRFKARVVRCRK